MQLSGGGTQKIEFELQNIIPKVKILRLDLDTSRKKGAHYQILKNFSDNKANILLGTQMIAKGLDFDKVTLVGVINADIGRLIPDFRSGERIFQLIYQVAGRSGRREKPGKAIIQTYNPNDIFIQSASRLNTKSFYNISLSQRKEFFYPPFSRISRIVFSGHNKDCVKELTYKVYAILQSADFILLGPSPTPIKKIRGNWRYHIVIKNDLNNHLSFQNYFMSKIDLSILEKKVNGVKTYIDIDPINII